LPEKYLDWAVLDAATADELGREHVGWFVGNHPWVRQATGQFARLDANPAGGVWIVIPLSWDLSTALFDYWPRKEHITNRPGPSSPVWQSHKVWVAPPEHLPRLLAAARSYPEGVAGLIVLDPPCIMYQARGGTDRWGRKNHNDRPQHVVNFRASLGSNGWQPPLLLLTERPAKSVNTEVVARAFCLNGFHFIDGDSFACWDEPIE
jgi:hypothetical protein